MNELAIFSYSIEAVHIGSLEDKVFSYLQVMILDGKSERSQS
jgi:hypothetical protein